MRITKTAFARRRKQLMDMMEPNSIAILPAAPERVRSRDTEYHYRQDSDFLYLSGFEEPQAVIALIPGREHGSFVMFVRERNREREIWDGYRAGPEGACEEFGADDAFPIDDIDDILPGLLEGRQRVYYAMGKDGEFDKQVMEWINSIRAKVRSGATPPGEFLDLSHILHDMRLFKSAAEIRVMKEAADISAAAHIRAMKACDPGVMEYQLEAEILHEFHRNGARFPAYNSIVGGGKNGCILHYIENSAAIYFDYNLPIITNTATTTIVLPTTTSETDERSDWWGVYPNPANSELNVVINTNNEKNVNIELQNVIGQSLSDIFKSNVTTEKTTISKNIEDLPKGIYFIKLTSDSGTEMKKFIKL